MFSLFRQESSHGRFKLPWLAIALTTIPVFAYLIFGPAPEWLVFDRAAVHQGEIWRLITAHWVHSDADHALWDITALGILSILLDYHSRKLLILSLAIGIVSVDIWVLYIDQSLLYYCGLSGILNTVLISVLFSLWKKTKSPVLWLIFSGAVGKVLLEMNSGQALLTQTAWPSVPEAHAVGLLAGLVLVMFKYLIIRQCDCT